MELTVFQKVILASASPRRRELLGKMFGDFEIITSDAEERMEGEISRIPEPASRQMALIKAEDVADRCPGDLNGTSLVIGADTIVSIGSEILGKPKDERDALDMLKRLSIAGEHMVHTGVALIITLEGKREILSFTESTRVEFYPLTEEEAEWYVSTGEPMDKAGAYGIQGLGSRFIRRIQGDYNNVVGLPVSRIYRELKDYSSDGILTTC